MKENIQIHDLSITQDLAYRVGALLYVPALYSGLSEKLFTDKLLALHSIAFCLEDSIQDDALKLAEVELCNTFLKMEQVAVNLGKTKTDFPLIFVRIRDPQHMIEIYDKISDHKGILTGFILPKFDLSNVSSYLDAILKINANRIETPLYFMPILESSSIASIETRHGTLRELKSRIDEVSDYILNIRVGGNDFCNYFGLRRSINTSIYDIGMVKDILLDILNVFGRDYIVSGPVWEYFDNNTSEDWLLGLKKEAALDRLNGFIGKTAIHPSQLSIITESLKVSRIDYSDALRILNWHSVELGVAKSSNGQRMNEVKVHKNWAKRISILASIYGVLDLND